MENITYFDNLRNPCFSHPATGPETLRPLSFHAQGRIGGSHVAGRREQNAKKVPKSEWFDHIENMILLPAI